MHAIVVELSSNLQRGIRRVATCHCYKTPERFVAQRSSHGRPPSLWSSHALYNVVAFDVASSSAIVVKLTCTLQRHGL
jgi:hypothetical protein